MCKKNAMNNLVLNAPNDVNCLYKIKQKCFIQMKETTEATSLKKNLIKALMIQKNFVW